MRKLRNFLTENKYMIYMVMFLIALHIMCNISIHMISFSSDEFIPVAIAAKWSGLDWMHSRKFNYYYGYIAPLLYSWIFKLPFVYRNSFLLTQALLLSNSILHITATCFIYKSLGLLFENSKSEKIIAVISVISTCSLQAFNTSLGVQVEGMIVLAYAVCFYVIVKLSKEKTTYSHMVLMAFFTYAAIASNSRGCVLLIAEIICLVLACLQGTEYKKKTLCFICVAITLICVHRYLIRPQYSVYFTKDAANTSSESITIGLRSMLTNATLLKSFIGVMIGWLWCGQLSTFGLFLIPFFMLAKQFICSYRTKDWVKMIIPLFIVLNIVGISVLCIAMFRTTWNGTDLAEVDITRADMWFYMRYYAGISVVSNAYALYGLLEDKAMSEKWEKILYICVTIAIGIVTVWYVADELAGGKYGMNNTVVAALFTHWVEENYRYGYVDTLEFCQMAAFAAIIAGIIVAIKKQKKCLICFFLILTMSTIGIYVADIAHNKSDYYENIFEDDIIEICREKSDLSIYAADQATTLQYSVPKGVVYYKFNDQDILVMNKEKMYLVNESKYQYRTILKTEKWRVLEKY